MPKIHWFLVVSRDSKKTPPTKLQNLTTVPLFCTTSGTAGIMPSCIVNIVSSCQDNGKHTFGASLAPRYENSSHLGINIFVQMIKGILFHVIILGLTSHNLSMTHTRCLSWWNSDSSLQRWWHRPWFHEIRCTLAWKTGASASALTKTRKFKFHPWWTTILH